MKKQTKSEMLYSVVSRMTSTQKKMFRFEMRKFSKSSYYFLIFDYFRDQKKFDKKLFKNFIDQNDIPNHYSVISYLLEKLALFIHRTRTESTKSKILEELNYINEKALAFTNLGFLSNATDLWKKMLEIADQYEEYQHCIASLVFLYRYNEYEYLKNFKYKDRLDLSVYDRINKYGLLYIKSNQFKVLHFNVIRLTHTKNSNEEDWLKINKSSLLKHLPEGNYLDNLHYYVAKGFFNLKVNGIEAANTIFKEYQKKQHKFIDQRDVEFGNIFDADYLYLISFYWCDKPNEYIIQANHFNGLMDLFKHKIHKSNEKKLLKMTIRFNLLNAIIQAQRLTFEKDYQIQDIQELFDNKKWLKRNKGKMMQANALLFCCYLCILIKEYKMYYKYQLLLEELISNLKGTSYFKYDFELLQLIELYENNTNYYFNNQLKHFAKKIKIQNDCSSSILKMTALLKRLSKSKQPQSLMKNYLLEIKSQEIKDANGNKVLPFYIWLQRRSEE